MLRETEVMKTAESRTVNMINDLMSKPSVVLQDVEVCTAGGSSDLFSHWEQLRQALIRDVCELFSVVLWDYKLECYTRVSSCIHYD